MQVNRVWLPMLRTLPGLLMMMVETGWFRSCSLFRMLARHLLFRVPPAATNDSLCKRLLDLNVHTFVPTLWTVSMFLLVLWRLTIEPIELLGLCMIWLQLAGLLKTVASRAVVNVLDLRLLIS